MKKNEHLIFFLPKGSESQVLKFVFVEVQNVHFVNYFPLFEGLVMCDMVMCDKKFETKGKKAKSKSWIKLNHDEKNNWY